MRVIDDSGKLTISLGIKEWGAVIFAIVAVTLYVFRMETAVKKHETRYVEAESTEARQDATLTNHGWRIKRMERKAGVSRPAYDDEDYVGPEPYRQRRGYGRGDR